jgi:hypothetical protein
VGNDVVNERSIHHAGRVELLARDGRADDSEDARADDSPNAERSQRPRAEGFLEPMLGFIRVPDELVDRFAGKQLAGQCGSPRSLGCGIPPTEAG